MADVPVFDGVTYPDAPDGFTLISYFRTWESFSEDVPVDVHSMEAFAWSELSQSDIQAHFDQLRQTAADNGSKILAFSASYAYEVNVSIPTEFCILGTCFQVPQQLCIPLTDFCTPVAGTTLVQTRRYRFWWCTQPVGFGATSEQVRGFGPVMLLIAVIGGLIALGVLVGVERVWSGAVSWTEFTTGFRSLFRAPGEVAKPITEEIPWTIWGLGFVMIGTAVIIPIAMARGYQDAGIQGSGHVDYTQKLPGGGTLGVGSSAGSGGAARHR